MYFSIYTYQITAFLLSSLFFFLSIFILLFSPICLISIYSFLLPSIFFLLFLHLLSLYLLSIYVLSSFYPSSFFILSMFFLLSIHLLSVHLFSSIYPSSFYILSIFFLLSSIFCLHSIHFPPFNVFCYIFFSSILIEVYICTIILMICTTAKVKNCLKIFRP